MNLLAFSQVFPVSPAAEDRRADFLRFYQARGAELFCFASVALDSPEEAEEATGNVFAAVWREWSGEHPVSSRQLRTLLLWACAATVARYHRPETGHESQAPWPMSPPSIADIGERAEILAKAWSQITKFDRELLTHVFLDVPPTPTEVNDMSDRTLVRRALHRLYRQMGAAGQRITATDTASSRQVSAVATVKS